MMIDKNLPLWYSDHTNDILQEAYANILERMDPDTESFILLYGRYDNKKTLMQFGLDEPEDVKQIRDFLVGALRDRLRKRNYKGV